jgi:diadenylate cyclase
MPFHVSETPLREVVDVVLVALLFYAILAWLRHARAQPAVAAAAGLGAAYLLARQAGLALTAWVLQGVAVTAVVLLVVVFQAELRRGLERLVAPLLGQRREAPTAGALEAVVRATLELAATRRGALIVIPGRESPDRHVEGGILLGGAVSVPLLLSLFDPNSPGHDGAVIVEGGKVTRFGVHLPLSADFAQLAARGTRHAAALGLAERCDAVVIVVSEERGSVCVARAGRLADVEGTTLSRLVGELTGRPAPSASLGRRAWAWLRTSGRDVLLAVAVSLVLWVALVPGSEVSETVVRVPVDVEDLPPGYVLEQVEPESVDVTVSGPRRTLLLAGPGDFALGVDAILVKLGRRSFGIDSTDVRHPRGVNVVAVAPGRVELAVHEPAGAAPPVPPSASAARAAARP